MHFESFSVVWHLPHLFIYPMWSRTLSDAAVVIGLYENVASCKTYSLVLVPRANCLYKLSEHMGSIGLSIRGRTLLQAWCNIYLYVRVDILVSHK